MRGDVATLPRWGATCCAPTTGASEGEGEEFEVAFAGEDDGEEAAVGGDAEFSDGDAVEDGARGGLEDGNVDAGFLREKRWDGDPDEVAGFSFDGAFEHDAVFVGRPMEHAEADTKTYEMVGSGEIAYFEDFSVDKVGDSPAAG